MRITLKVIAPDTSHLVYEKSGSFAFHCLWQPYTSFCSFLLLQSFPEFFGQSNFSQQFISYFSSALAIPSRTFLFVQKNELFTIELISVEVELDK